MRELRVDDDGRGPIVALHQQIEQFAFRAFGQIADRPAHAHVCPVNDELPRRADTLLDRFRRRSRAEGAHPDHEKTINSGGTHRFESPKLLAAKRAENRPKIFLFPRNLIETFRDFRRVIKRRESNENNQTSYYGSRARRDGEFVRDRPTRDENQRSAFVPKIRDRGEPLESSPLLPAAVEFLFRHRTGLPDYGYGYPYYGSYPYGYDYGYYAPRTTVYVARGINDDATVAAVQRRLARGGYYHGAIDGVIGAGTRNAIRAFETQQRPKCRWRNRPQLLRTMGLA